MKYIRTKDGRIIKVPFSKEEYERNYKNNNVSYEEWFGCLCFSLDILNQADTIEGLCDEFVLVDTENGYCGILPKDKDFKFDKVNMGNAYGRIFYGAIWTDKGLIYVAKMNQKGELELL